jgi:hypothetical protein
MSLSYLSSLTSTSLETVSSRRGKRERGGKRGEKEWSWREERVCGEIGAGKCPRRIFLTINLDSLNGFNETEIEYRPNAFCNWIVPAYDKAFLYVRGRGGEGEK